MPQVRRRFFERHACIKSGANRTQSTAIYVSQAAADGAVRLVVDDEIKIKGRELLTVATIHHQRLNRGPRLKMGLWFFLDQIAETFGDLVHGIGPSDAQVGRDEFAALGHVANNGGGL